MRISLLKPHTGIPSSMLDSAGILPFEHKWQPPSTWVQFRAWQIFPLFAKLKSGSYALFFPLWERFFIISSLSSLIWAKVNTQTLAFVGAGSRQGCSRRLGCEKKKQKLLLNAPPTPFNLNAMMRPDAALQRSFIFCSTFSSVAETAFQIMLAPPPPPDVRLGAHFFKFHLFLIRTQQNSHSFSYSSFGDSAFWQGMTCFHSLTNSPE